MSRINNFFIASSNNDFQPPALSYKAFLIYGVIVIVLRLLLGALPASSSAIESDTLMDIINVERKSRNLIVLATHKGLLTAARQKAEDMIDRDYFGHVDPDGNYVWPKIIAAGYGAYKILGENLAVDFTTAEGMIKAWLDSPTHRANLLHEEFREQGLSALYGDYQGRYTNLTASLFGTRQSPALPPVQTPVAAPPQPPPAVKSTPPALPPVQTPVAAPSIIEEPTAPIEHAPPPVGESAKPVSISVQPKSNLSSDLTQSFTFSRILFTAIGALLLALLLADSIIIHRHLIAESALSQVQNRSHSSYHLTSFLIITLISILIWWW